jgi:hypothetical protein
MQPLEKKMPKADIDKLLDNDEGYKFIWKALNKKYMVALMRSIVRGPVFADIEDTTPNDGMIHNQLKEEIRANHMNRGGNYSPFSDPLDDRKPLPEKLPLVPGTPYTHFWGDSYNGVPIKKEDPE